MSAALIARADALWDAANRLLGAEGLLALIQAVGPAQVVGSAAYNLMTRPDIDISMQIADGQDVAAAFALGERIANRYRVGKMTFSNFYVREDTPFDHGLYWGVILPYAGETWQVDLWAFAPPFYAEQIAFSESLHSRLAAVDRLTVLALKDGLMQRGVYRSEISSIALYEAVIAGVRSLDEFDSWWEAAQCAS